MAHYAPIALFVYNRADHARQTIAALQANALAGKSELFVFSDAPKNEAAAAAVGEVRQLIHSVTGFKAIHVIEREQNWGLARSIITGVTELVDRYGRVIVLEDDLVTSPYFLDYMNDALDRYEAEERVMHISGYMFPIDRTGMKETFFLRTTSCWGWATWARAWQHFEKAPEALVQAFSHADIRSFNMDGTHNFWIQVQQNYAGLIDTWAVFWYATVFRRKGLCLHPATSMATNIGNDGTGVHCGSTQAFNAQLAAKPVTWFETNLMEAPLALARTKAFFSSLRPSLIERIRNKMKNTLQRLQVCF